MEPKDTRTRAQLIQALSERGAFIARQTAENAADKARFRELEKSLNEALTAEREENDRLRALLHEFELNCERMRGYLDGKADAEPLRMVPEDRQPRLARYVEREMQYGAGSVTFDPRGGYVTNRNPKPWYLR